MSGIEGIGGAKPQYTPPYKPVAPGGGFSGMLQEAGGGPGVEIQPPLRGPVVKSFSPAHPAVDIGAPQGSSVHAALEGVVESSGWAGDRGNLLVVRSGSTRSYYGHLQGFEVKPGQSVVAGDLLAISGATGATSQPALHFEVHQDGKAVDPAPYLS